ncbi:MAG: hypothetical protein OXO50_15945 [Caldilineaceae bacterium]|nr:hypothetical protein [Caldilineaceae bacterium]
MTHIEIPFERFLFRHDSWRSHRAIDEIEIYCELLEILQDKIDALETRGKDEEITLINVQAVISSYAVEIAMKSLWALDHPDKPIPHTHDLVRVFDGLKEETRKSLEGIQLTRQVMEVMPSPFASNRYSMEQGGRDISVYQTSFLRDVAQFLRDKLEESKKALFKPLKPSTT